MRGERPASRHEDVAAVPVWFFGCMRRPGHWYWTPRGEQIYADLNSVPWDFYVDGRFTPAAREQGAASLVHQDGWTILAFHDYTVDSRPGSNGAFIAPGTVGYDDVMALAFDHFRHVLARVGPIFLAPVSSNGATDASS